MSRCLACFYGIKKRKNPPFLRHSLRTLPQTQVELVFVKAMQHKDFMGVVRAAK